MIIQCEKCATKFRLDDSRISNTGVKVRCTKCQNVFVVMPPPQADEVEVEELFGVPAATQGAARAGKRAEAAKPKQEEKKNLTFDFDEDGDTGSGHKPEQDSPAPSGSFSEERGDKVSFDGMDFSFSEDHSAQGGWEEKAEGKSEDFEKGWDLGAEKIESEEGAAFSKTADETLGGPADFGFDAGQTPSAKDKSEFDFSFGDLSSGETSKDGWDTEQEKETVPEKSPEHAPVAAAAPSLASAYTNTGKAQPPADDIGGDEDFGEVLTKSLQKETTRFEAPDSGADDEPDAAPRKAPASTGLILALLILVVGGALIYMTGVIDRLTMLFMPPSASQVKAVDIESVTGFFAENRNIGKVFVIQGKIKNSTDQPQPIKAATGVIYNQKGGKIASRSVSPGRVVSIDDVKNLPAEDLERAFKDPSGGVIPPKGTVPVMVLFTNVPEGLSEYGVDIVR